MPQTDTIKLLASVGVGVFLVVGGILLLVLIYFQPVPAGSSADAKTAMFGLISGFVGFGINFLFQTNTQAAVRGQTRSDLLTNSLPPDVVEDAA